MRRGAIYGALLFVVLAGLLAYNRIPREGEGDGGGERAVTLVAQNILLPGGEENALRVRFRPGDPSARIIATLRETTAPAVALCPLARLDDPLPPPERCPDAASGVRESITGDGALGAVAIVLDGEGTAQLDLRLEFREGERALGIRLPLLRPPHSAAACRDNECNPFFELIPNDSARPTAGDLRATARWQSGRARLQLLQGSVRARSYTATGIPYRIAGSDEGGSPLEIRATMSAPGEYALAVTATGGADLRNVLIEARWP